MWLVLMCFTEAPQCSPFSSCFGLPTPGRWHGGSAVCGSVIDMCGDSMGWNIHSNGHWVALGVHLESNQSSQEVLSQEIIPLPQAHSAGLWSAIL